MNYIDLQNHLEHYLELRRALGFTMRLEGRLLRDFLAFLEQRSVAEPLVAQAALDWACSRGSTNGSGWQARRLSIARCFLVHLRAHLPGIEVPATGIIPHSVRPTPYIYSEAEIVALMNEARALKPVGSLRPHTYATLIGLLASSGLRPGEAVRLRDADVNLDSQPPRLLVRETKFHKSRLVPLAPSTADALRSYAAIRKRLGCASVCETFFVSESGTPLAYSTVGRTFLGIVRSLAIHPTAGSRGSNLRCLRHTFAVRRMLDWYSRGVDVNKHLPYLSVFLGHAKPQCTYWYLTATPELLSKAGSRFESYVNGGEI
jgi:integrase/recombinase XerD